MRSGELRVAEKSTVRVVELHVTAAGLAELPEVFPVDRRDVGVEHLLAGLVFAGTDDGRVWRSDDAGKYWYDLSATVLGLPQSRWITRVECSHFAAGTVFLAVDRHRNDDFGPYLFKSTDHGKTHREIQGRINRETKVKSVANATIDQLERGNEILRRDLSR